MENPNRKTIALSIGPILLRRLNKLDHLEIFSHSEMPKFRDAMQQLRDGLLQGINPTLAQTKEFAEFICRCIERAVVEPKIVTTGLPTKDGPIHIFDLTDDDVDILRDEILSFALGGARREQFPESDRSAPASGAGPDRDTVRPAALRAPLPA